MHDNAHSKRTGFWKSLIATAAITLSIFSNTEARVRREVAEAIIPYLLEVAGIPQAQQINAQRNAIIQMLYTNDGQREMVDWARNGVFPPTLKHVFAPLLDQPALGGGQKRKVEKFFPYQPANTFSSYASNDSRVGWYALDPAQNIVTICGSLIIKSDIGLHNKVKDVINIGDAIWQNMNSKLAAILFTLDICDNANQIFNILDAKHAVTNIAGYEPGAHGAIASVYNEYDHRPISATFAAGQGDCVQTLYRHLINIAVQNDETNSINYNIGHIPDDLKNNYYGPVHVTGFDPMAPVTPNVLTIPVTKGEAGLTWLAYHQSWHDALTAAVPRGTDIINGTANNIANVLTHVCPLNVLNQPDMLRSTLGNRGGVYPHALALTIQSSDGTAETTDHCANADAIRDALNALDGRCSNVDDNNRRFLVSVTDNMADPNAPPLNVRPVGTNQVIQIADKLWNRTITICCCAGGHAEIISIQ